MSVCGIACIHSLFGVSQAFPGRCTPGWRPCGPASCSTAGHSSRASSKTSAASTRTSTRRSCSRTASRSCSRSCESARFFNLDAKKKLISGSSDKRDQREQTAPRYVNISAHICIFPDALRASLSYICLKYSDGTFEGTFVLTRACLSAERGDKPAAVGHLHPLLRPLPHPQADGDQEEADLTLR